MNLHNFIAKNTLNLRVLFISFSSDNKQTVMTKYLPNADFAQWDDIHIDNGELFSKDQKVSSYKFVVIGTVGKNVQLKSCLEEVIATNKIGCFRYGSPTEENNKLLQTIKMKNGGIPQINTIIGKAKSLKSSSLIRELKLPIVSKIIDGSQGKGIKKHETKASLDDFLKKNAENTYIFQEFIPNDGDIRALYVKERLIYCITRKSQKEGEFRNNVSLGGTAEFVEPTPEIKSIGLSAARAMRFDVTGVDLIQHKETKQWYVMEINSAPQFMVSKVDEVCRAILDHIK